MGIPLQAWANIQSRGDNGIIIATCKVQRHVAHHRGTNKDEPEVEAGERGMIGIDGTGTERERN